MSESEARTEGQQERLNRQLSELLQELRIAMPGVQVLSVAAPADLALLA